MVGLRKKAEGKEKGYTKQIGKDKKDKDKKVRYKRNGPHSTRHEGNQLIPTRGARARNLRGGTFLPRALKIRFQLVKCNITGRGCHEGRDTLSQGIQDTIPGSEGHQPVLPDADLSLNQEPRSKFSKPLDELQMTLMK